MGRTVRVGALALAVRERGQERRAAWLIEDALRVASLPGLPAGALVAVRRLALGALSLGESAQALATRLDRSLLTLPGGAVRITTAPGPAASVVWAVDATEALAALAIQLAAGSAAAQWWWPRLLPGWQAAASSADGLRAVLTIAAASHGLLGHARLLAALAGVPAQAALLAAVTPAAVTSLALPRAQDPRLAPAAVSRLLPAELRTWVARWGFHDQRSRWLAALVVVQTAPALVNSTALAAVVADLLHRSFDADGTTADTDGVHVDHGRQPGRGPSSREGAAKRQHTLLPAKPEATPNPMAVALDVGRSAVAGTIAGRGVPPLTALAAEMPPARQTRRAPPVTALALAAAQPWIGTPTAWAGVPLLIALLQRLGMADLLDGHPALAAADVGRRALLRLALGAGAPTDDAACAWLPPSPPRSDVTAWVSPPVWHALVRAPRRAAQAIVDRRGRLALARWAGAPPDLPEPLASAQRTAIAATPDLFVSLRRIATRWLYATRAPGERPLGLRALVRRPGLVLATATHLDVTFPLRDADIRLRRRGLDVDPGWVPWLGMVVSVRFVESR